MAVLTGYEFVLVIRANWNGSGDDLRGVPNAQRWLRGDPDLGLVEVIASGLSPGTTYAYQVLGYYDDGSEKRGQILEFTTPVPLDGVYDNRDRRGLQECP